MSDEKKMLNDDEKDIRKLKNITIRGIDSSIYDDFSHSMKMLNMNIGDAVTKMMRDVMEDLDETFINMDISSKLSSKKLFGRLERAKISHHRYLEISGEDLIDANAQLSFNHIDELKILPDVTREVFTKYIRSINHCKKVMIPNILPKLLLLSKINFCDQIEVYSAENNAIQNNIESTSVSDNFLHYDED